MAALFAGRIDNSAGNVTERLTYLSQTPDEMIRAGYPAIKLPLDAVCTIPRKIDFSIKRLEYAVMLRPEDALHYPYDDHQIETLINCPSYTNPDNKMPIGTLMYELSRRAPTFFDEIPHRGNPACIIPLRYYLTEDELDLTLPKDLIHALGITDPASRTTLETNLIVAALSEPSWVKPSYRYNDMQVSNYVGFDDLQPKYVVPMYVVMDIRINGIPADRYNLTHAEQSEIIRTLKDKSKTRGTFLSDGRENEDDLPYDRWNRYEAKIKETRPEGFAKLYGRRDADIPSVKHQSRKL